MEVATSCCYACWLPESIRHHLRTKKWMYWQQYQVYLEQNSILNSSWSFSFTHAQHSCLTYVLTYTERIRKSWPYPYQIHNCIPDSHLGSSNVELDIYPDMSIGIILALLKTLTITNAALEWNLMSNILVLIMHW